MTKCPKKCMWQKLYWSGRCHISGKMVVTDKAGCIFLTSSGKKSINCPRRMLNAMEIWRERAQSLSGKGGRPCR